LKKIMLTIADNDIARFMVNLRLIYS
jgi:hypothetical protein